jgi:hypothetical protein
MGGSAAPVSQQSVSQSLSDGWALEIRDYLLGRLSMAARIDPLPTVHESELTHQPIRRWWIFEGKHYATLGGNLAHNWDTAILIARRLDETFNPMLRLSDRPDGVVDWGHTLARGPNRLRPEYVVSSSGVGLNEHERTALRGWACWIGHEWAKYTRVVATEQRVQWGSFTSEWDGRFTIDRLKRWAHTARRSRWPLLREVVAESIRPVLEPTELDRIPLPSDRSHLFELLCLVRIARSIAPAPRELCWVDKESTDNIVRLEGVTCHYQQSLKRKVVLATPDYTGALARSIDAFHVGIPQYVDLAFDFDEPRAGFDGLIVEAKSGNQQFRNAVAQLRTYRAARTRRPGSRYLVWAIVEGPGQPESTRSSLVQTLASSDNSEDLWLFSSADEIGLVLESVLGTDAVQKPRVPSTIHL